MAEQPGPPLVQMMSGASSVGLAASFKM